MVKGRYDPYACDRNGNNPEQRLLVLKTLASNFDDVVIAQYTLILPARGSGLRRASDMTVSRVPYYRIYEQRATGLHMS
jgi:hypothetical protein